MKLGSFSFAVKLIRQSYKLHVPTLESDKDSLVENLKLGRYSNDFFFNEIVSYFFSLLPNYIRRLLSRLPVAYCCFCLVPL